jgi:hypothetical protein
VFGLFKKKTSIEQFVAEVIMNTINIYEDNIDKVIKLCDESDNLKDIDKKSLKESISSLVLAGTIINIYLYFKKHISTTDAGELVTVIYLKYMKEQNKIDEKQIEDNLTKTMKIIEGLENYDESLTSKFQKEEDKLRFICCKSFADIYAGNDIKNDYVQYKIFVAFKLAKNLVNKSIIGLMLKDYKISWNK